MSATNRGAERNTADLYITPDYTIDSLLSKLEIDKKTRFLEPCRANGAIYNRVPASQKLWAEIGEGVDYLRVPFGGIDLTITNPPFSLALEFLTKSLTESRNVFYLLRMGFLASQSRQAFWLKHPPTHLLVLSKRPVFAWFCVNKACRKAHPVGVATCECGARNRAGTDATDYAWFGWVKDDLLVKSKERIQVV